MLHRKPEESRQKDKLLPIRNILNIIFMLGAIIGVIIYFYSDQTVGTFVILAAMAVKMAECCMRLLHK